MAASWLYPNTDRTIDGTTYRIGDRVTLTDSPGTWTIDRLDPDDDRLPIRVQHPDSTHSKWVLLAMVKLASETDTWEVGDQFTCSDHPDHPAQVYTVTYRRLDGTGVLAKFADSNREKTYTTPFMNANALRYTPPEPEFEVGHLYRLRNSSGTTRECVAVRGDWAILWDDPATTAHATHQSNRDIYTDETDPNT